MRLVVLYWKLLLLLCFTFTAVSALLPPTPSWTLHYRYTDYNVAEGTSVQCELYTWMARKSYLNCSTVYGYYVEYVNVELGNLTAVVYDTNGRQECAVEQHPAPQYAPIPFLMAYSVYVSQQVFLGEKVNVFRMPQSGVARYVVTLMTDAKTNTRPVNIVVGSGENTHITEVWEENQVTEDDPHLVFPPSCTPQLQTLGQSSNVRTLQNKHYQKMNQEQIINKGWKEKMTTEDGGGVLQTLPIEAVPMEKTALEKLAADHTILSRHFLSFDEAFYNSERNRQRHTKNIAILDGHHHHHHLGQVPTEVDNSKFATPVRDQGGCGGCWAFSTAAASEIIWNKQRNQTHGNQNNTDAWLSVQAIIDCLRGDANGTMPVPCQGCTGGWSLTALMYTAAYGLPMDLTYPFDFCTGTHCRRRELLRENNHPFSSSSDTLSRSTSTTVYPISAAIAVPSNNVSAMKYAIAHYGAVTAGMNVPWKMSFWSTNEIYDDEDCPPGIGHFVTIVGYGLSEKDSSIEYWLVKQSFGPGWGSGGYYRVKAGVNLCYIEANVASALPSSQQP